jgi:hypothetical protein
MTCTRCSANTVTEDLCFRNHDNSPIGKESGSADSRALG